MKKFALFILVLLLLVACQSSPVANDTPVPQATDSLPTVAPPTATAVPPTDTPVPPTDTPMPPADTPEPTQTAELEVAPESQSLNYLTFHGNPASGTWDQTNFDQFIEMHPEVTAVFNKNTLYSSPVPRAIHNFASQDEPADVIASYIVGNLRTYVEQGLITDISDLWAEQGWDEQFPANLKEFATIDGKQYFVPLAAQWNPVWYRTDIFEEVGLTPPTSWDEFLTICDTLHEAGYIPVTAALTNWNPPIARWFTILNLRLNGAEFHESLIRGHESYEDPRVRAVFDHWAEMIDHNCFPDNPSISYSAAANQIYNGEAAMYDLGEWLAEAYSGGLPDTFDFFNFPLLDPDVMSGEIALVYGAFIPAKAQNPQVARDFLAFLGSADSLTTRKDTLNQLVLNLDVEHSTYSPVYQKGLAFMSEADHITQLFEMNAHPDMAQKGLTEFARFYTNPDLIDLVLANLEAARLEVHGE